MFSRLWPERGSNLQPSTPQSSALTTRPRRLPCSILIYVLQVKKEKLATGDCVEATGVQFDCDTCTLDGITKQAAVLFPECEEKLCESCEGWHQNSRMSRDHSVILCVIPVSEMSVATPEETSVLVADKMKLTNLVKTIRS